jgi:A nuclease family of the HNH/ENDO VII superfamily with conserved AHH
MSDEEHERGFVVNQFCAAPGNSKCGCGQDYIKNCEPSWKSMFFWASRNTYQDLHPGNKYSFIFAVSPKGVARIKKFAKHISDVKSFKKYYEAHHVVCVSSVNNVLAEDTEVRPVIENTVWCINRSMNMLAMPLWGHTIRWYCSILTETVQSDRPAPPFKDIPMHDIDHNTKTGYTQEVTTRLQKGLNGIKKQKEKHKINPSDIAGLLDSLSTRFKNETSTRGLRGGGTHAAWQRAVRGLNLASWYKPFSMASNGNETSRTFPSMTSDKVNQLAMSILGR